jgi:AsmA protein
MARGIRIAIWAIVAVIVLIVAGVGVFIATFDPNSYKPRIVAAVKQATGRDLDLQGNIHLGLSLQPTLTVENVSLSNPPGFSRPQMMTLQELDLKLALLPLLSHQVEIDRLVLIKPDVLLERNAQGQVNWNFAPQSTPTTPAAPSTPGEKSQTQINVAELQVQNGTVTWRDDATKQSAVLGVTSLTTSAPSPDANLHLAMNAAYNGNPFNLSGDVGPLTRLQDTAAKTAWPVQLTVQAAGAKLALNGSVSQPEQARGYNLKITANVPDLTALAPFAGGKPLPPLHDIDLATQVADTGAKLPEISNLTLHVGPSDLTSMVAGLKLTKLDVAVPQPTQPAQIAAEATFDNKPATLNGTAGLLPVLMSGGRATQPVPIDLSAKFLDSSVSVKGTAAEVGGRPSVQATVHADRLNADQLIAATAKPAAPPPPAASGAPAAPAAHTAPPAPAPASNRVFPDTPIPFDMLRAADADVKLSIGEMTWGGAQYKAIGANIDLHNGALKLEQVSADLPAGHLTGAMTAVDTPPAPPVTLRLDAPSLALGPIFAAMGKPDYVAGNVDVQANLNGAGATPHAIAASLNGTLGISMANGKVDNRLLGSSLGQVLQAVNALDLVGRGGSSDVQCFAVRMVANHGVGNVEPLVLSASMMTMEGGGTINLGTETLDLRVRPQGRVAGTPIVVPLRVTGSLRSPSVASDTAATIGANAGTVAGSVLGKATPFGAVAGVLGGEKLLGGGGEEVNCSAALAAARGQAVPAAAPAAAAPPAPAPQKAQPKAPNPGQLLQKLFR